MPDRLWTDAEHAAAHTALHDRIDIQPDDLCDETVAAVLDAVAPLIAARVRARVAEEIAALRGADASTTPWHQGWRDAITAATHTARRTPTEGTTDA